VDRESSANPGEETYLATTVTPEATSTSLQELAKRHLWMHFTRMGAYADGEVPIIVRGEGPYVYDDNGSR